MPAYLGTGGRQDSLILQYLQPYASYLPGPSLGNVYKKNEQASSHARNTKLTSPGRRADIFLEGDRGAVRVDVTVVCIHDARRFR